MPAIKLKDRQSGKWTKIPTVRGKKGDKPINGVDYNTHKEKEEFKDAVVAYSKEDIDKHAATKKDELETIADGVKDMATAIQFATFEVNNNMELTINTADKLKNTNFSVNEETGELEVEIV